MKTKIEIIEGIKSRMELLGQKLYSDSSSDTEWTSEIKKLFYDLTCEDPQNLPYGTLPSTEEDGGNRQWLYDLIWYESSVDLTEKNLEYKPFKSLPLVMECEWKTDYENLVWDFDKLIVAKAGIKVFIFQSPPGGGGSNPQTTFIKLVERVNVFYQHSPDEYYLLACWNRVKNPKFEFATYNGGQYV